LDTLCACWPCRTSDALCARWTCRTCCASWSCRACCALKADTDKQQSKRLKVGEVSRASAARGVQNYWNGAVATKNGRCRCDFKLLEVGVNVAVLNDDEIICFEQRNKDINVIAVSV
jgi:hypothetical protein